MDPMYPHTITVWRPEAVGRDVSWRNAGTLPCRFDMERTVTSSTSGSDTAWVATILIPVPCPDPPLMRGDKVALGTFEEDAPIDSYKVTRCDPVSLDAPTPNHWEAEAR